ncbi:Choline dehydrogenase [Roseateles sp. YR242]|uniref:GMC oxidoreductase n=1 Tax=Roseateles sp. YR242 TaxID=1855305 RepID=UPI0008B7D1AC|nr:GMC oxidoreductase [Roseateles sp. YR242]SEL85815.1 Choline dehydrogenase [Roseateles sp. YR242]
MSAVHSSHAPVDRVTLLAQARDPLTTPFDYIVVGSGAGGGTMAARLALGGKRVLLLEAGGDASLGPDGKLLPIKPGDNTSGGERQVAVVPAFHGAATEDAQMSWTFSVRHYDDDHRQRRDAKYNAGEDPSQLGGAGKGGIQYPRTAAIGGCTAHYAMIIIRPNDADWDWIADRTNDPSWRSDYMQGYFPKIEKCLYYGVYNTFGRRFLGSVLTTARKIATFINPRRQLDPGGHGTQGWLPTSFIDPLVIASIVKGDRTFLRVLLDVALATLGGKDERGTFLRSLAHLQLLQFLDPNVRSPDLPSRAHLSLISIGTDGKRRQGLREHLLRTQKCKPQHLVIETGVHVTRVVFERSADAGMPPRAIGVELLQGQHLYRASPLAGTTSEQPVTLQLFARQEVIVCGGAFNTPQVLMLSGIGDREALSSLNIAGPRDRTGQVIAPIVHLPGVGWHMQDRYEVSVITEAGQDFSTLKGVTFVPDTPSDVAAQQWLKDGSGLYSTNGGALAMMMSSTANQAVRRDPDLFIFGVPAAFRGYYWGYSKELLWAHKGVDKEQRNLWSWVILKAYTHNRHGSVRLRTADPLDVPQIDFHSFDEGDDDPQGAGAQEDVNALAEAVTRVREINKKIAVFGNEVQPGPGLPPGKGLDQWIRDEAWGHHACGTCRIGADRWTPDPARLTEPDAVLSSDFRVHGVQGLRVVDASVFPRIPGYFIVTPTYMIGEKAADVLLADSQDYPRALRAVEAQEIHRRRMAAKLPLSTAPAREADELPADTVGLALSGGGVRSATFCLGVLQALAARGRLRQVDMISSVSGGGYIGAFLGRLFTQQSECVEDKAGRVEAILTTPSSPEVWWLRKHANYIDSGSRTDLQSDVAIVLRNLAFVHVWIGALVFGLFGLARLLVDAWPEPYVPAWTFHGIGLSPWWPLPVLILLLAVVPTAAGYWFVLKDPHEGRGVLLPLWLWVALLGCAVFALGVPALLPWGGLALVLLLLAWTAQEVASWGIPDDDPERARRGPKRAAGTPAPTPPSLIIRTRLSRALGSALFGLGLTLAWVVLDSVSRAAGEGDFTVTGWSMLVLPPLLALLRGVAMQYLGGKPTPLLPSRPLAQQLLLASVAFGLLILLLFYLDAMVHWSFRWPDVGPWLVFSTLLASLVVARIFPFLNLSSLQAGYAQKLVRNFLGASNAARVHPPGVDAPVPINLADAGDDIDFDAYRPQQHGGPLHLIGACVNDTVDRNSGRQLRDDKGLSLCVGPAGLSIGRRHHALWKKVEDERAELHRVPVEPLRVAPDPNQFHVLARRDGKPVEVERLKLGQWTAISGAAYTTGLGRGTTLAKSLLLGLLNIRIGYWWDSGIAAGQRPGRFPPGLWRRIKSLPGVAFRLQAALLDEWRAWFPGASSQLWYLSDGGHFDNTGVYELVRRRLPFIVAVDASQDEAYQFDDLALLTRQVRLDFNATIEWLCPADLQTAVPGWIAQRIDLGALGALSDLKRDGTHYAAMARISYANQPGEASWLLLVKPSVGANIPTDVRYYAQTHAAFPNQSTANQFFDDDQWEAYRMLGQDAGLSVFR